MAMKTQTVIPIIQWACSNAELNAFEYRDIKSPYHQDSKSFVQKVLLAFIQDCGVAEPQGFWIPDDVYVANHHSAEPLTPGHGRGLSAYGEQPAPSEAHQAFREALSAQILQLTGTKPRIVYELNDTTGQMQWRIFRE